MNYSNPRKSVTIEDWPYGSKRTRCKFLVEKSKGKERAVRITTNPKNGRDNKPKKLTYARKVLFVDGDDGRTYVMNQVGHAINIMQSNMKYTEEYISTEDTRFGQLNLMFMENENAED
ncbi:MAG: hypothetical protein JRJ00_00805 [Deltaproteobacteria bacterium]|nr:hypothetical protein [Deltaproteobacteria bacterium]